MYRSHKEEVLAVGDETGTLKLYNYPCVSKQVCTYEKNSHMK